jgi:hypothetical protein
MRKQPEDICDSSPLDRCLAVTDRGKAKAGMRNALQWGAVEVSLS